MNKRRSNRWGFLSLAFNRRLLSVNQVAIILERQEFFRLAMNPKKVGEIALLSRFLQPTDCKRLLQLQDRLREGTKDPPSGVFDIVPLVCRAITLARASLLRYLGIGTLALGLITLILSGSPNVFFATVGGALSLATILDWTIFSHGLPLHLRVARVLSLVFYVAAIMLASTLISFAIHFFLSHEPARLGQPFQNLFGAVSLAAAAVILYLVFVGEWRNKQLRLCRSGATINCIRLLAASSSNSATPIAEPSRALVLPVLQEAAHYTPPDLVAAARRLIGLRRHSHECLSLWYLAPRDAIDATGGVDCFRTVAYATNPFPASEAEVALLEQLAEEYMPPAFDLERFLAAFRAADRTTKNEADPRALLREYQASRRRHLETDPAKGDFISAVGYSYDQQRATGGLVADCFAFSHATLDQVRATAVDSYLCKRWIDVKSFYVTPVSVIQHATTELVRVRCGVLLAIRTAATRQWSNEEILNIEIAASNIARVLVTDPLAQASDSAVECENN